MTTDQIIDYFHRMMAEDRLKGDIAGLKNLQATAGVLMQAAQYHGDKELAKRFQILAAQMANYREALESQ